MDTAGYFSSTEAPDKHGGPHGSPVSPLLLDLRPERARPGKARPRDKPARRVRPFLLQLDRGACLLQLALDRVGLLLVHALLDGARGTVDEVLRLLQAEAGDGPDDLDHLDLLVASGAEDDVERRLL